VIPPSLTLRRPDDWHVHLRDGALLRAVLPYTARRFARAIVMPNLVPPITTVAAAISYRQRIMAALPGGISFTPLMAAYLTDDADSAELARGYREGVFTAAKLYPAKATTNSAAGVTDVAKLYPVFERMAELGMPLLIHGEVTDPAVDVFDREAVFIERILAPLVRWLPQLKVVLEHITTKEAVAFVESAGANLAATITAHHLLINRNALFEGGLRPHMYCLPVAKREPHRLALRRAATSGNSKFFLGTDTAPHLVADKERDCGCAGIFSAPVALEVYAGVFAEEDALERFEAFASANGPRFYELALNEERITMRPEPWTAPLEISAGPGALRPFLAGETIAWRVVP
jgi:dihydroorotase